MSIKYIQFAPGYIASIGTQDIATISGWTHDKHGKSVRAERMTNGGVMLHILTGPNAGDTIEMPPHSIGSIRCDRASAKVEPQKQVK